MNDSTTPGPVSERPTEAPTFVTEEHRDGIATVILDRPRHRNSLNYELAAELLDAVIRAVNDPATRVLVLTGAGSAFCAGDDIEAVRQAREGMRAGAPASRLTRDYLYLRLCEVLLTARKPVIAALNGATVGAGTEIACAADYRLASDRVRIGSGLVRVGYAGNAALLPRVVGPARATELFVTGRLADAAEAERIGLVDRVVPHASFEKELDVLATGLAKAPTRAIGFFKELRERCWGQPAEFALRLQNEFHHRGHSEIEDGREGLDAFLNGREPDFTGR